MKSFKSLGVCDKLISTLQKQGIKEPTPIQEQSIPIVFKGNDIIAKAQTGTGKTLAFLLPILQRVHTDVHQEQVLIIAPTRELIKQISDEAKVLGSILGVDILPLIGGKTIESQLQQLGRRPQVILGTPGRLLDHAKRGSLHLNSIRRVVLDEADQMLHMGFLPDIENLIGQTDANRQLLLFSATIPDKIRNLAKAYMSKPVSVTAEGKHITLDAIDQRVYMMNTEEKTSRLIKMIQDDNPYLAIVFCNKREGAIRLSYELTAAGLNIAEMHGDLTQGRRTQILRDFAKAKTQILVATDIAARGIDIEGITHVYNYDVPHDVDYYIHRIDALVAQATRVSLLPLLRQLTNLGYDASNALSKQRLLNTQKTVRLKLKAMPARRQNVQKLLGNLRLPVLINLQKQKLIKHEAIKVPIHGNAVPLQHR